MTAIGWILFVIFAIAILGLLGQGIKSALRIDKWSDLRQKNKQPETGRTFRVTITNIFTDKENRANK